MRAATSARKLSGNFMASPLVKRVSSFKFAMPTLLLRRILSESPQNAVNSVPKSIMLAPMELLLIFLLFHHQCHLPFYLVHLRSLVTSRYREATALGSVSIPAIGKISPFSRNPIYMLTIYLVLLALFQASRVLNARRMFL